MINEHEKCIAHLNRSLHSDIFSSLSFLRLRIRHQQNVFSSVKPICIMKWQMKIVLNDSHRDERVIKRINTSNKVINVWENGTSIRSYFYEHARMR